MEHLGKVAKARVLDMAIAVGPTITGLATQFSEAFKRTDEWRENLELLKDTIEGVGKVAAAVATGIVNLTDSIGTLARVAGTMSSPLREKAKAAMGPYGRSIQTPNDSITLGQAWEITQNELKSLRARAERRSHAAFKLLSNPESPEAAADRAKAAAVNVNSTGGSQTPPDVPDNAKTGTEVPKVDLSQERSALAVALDRLDVERERLRVSFSMPSFSKRQEEIQLLQQERSILTDTVAELEHKAALETDETRRATYTREVLRVKDQQRDLERRQVSLEGTPDPYSLGDQMMASITALREQFGTEAQMIARAFTSTIGSAVNAVQQGIRGLIDGTKSWGEALNSIRMGIINGMIDAISRMFAEWIVGRAMAGMAHIAWSLREGVATKAALAPGALMASVSSYGAAAVIGAGALAAALAAMGTFKEGGFTGDGSSDSVAGLVHRGEFVVPADVTAAWGVPTLEAIRSGALTPSDLERSEIVPVVNNVIETPQVSVLWARDEHQLRDLCESELFAGHVVKVIRQRRTEAGIG